MFESLLELLAPWKDFYSDSVVISTIVTGAHIIALLIGGGLAIAADRTTLRVLRAGPERLPDHLVELGDVHRPIIVSLGVLAITGVLMATADLAEFVGEPIFWIKLGLVTLLLLNGASLYRAERGLRAEPSEHAQNRLKRVSRVSATLWIVTAIAGIVLTNAA
jgi:hypothetical protein